MKRREKREKILHGCIHIWFWEQKNISERDFENNTVKTWACLVLKKKN